MPHLKNIFSHSLERSFKISFFLFLSPRKSRFGIQAKSKKNVLCDKRLKHEKPKLPSKAEILEKDRPRRAKPMTAPEQIPNASLPALRQTENHENQSTQPQKNNDRKLVRIKTGSGTFQAREEAGEKRGRGVQA
jgi:hypothetical protein